MSTMTRKAASVRRLDSICFPNYQGTPKGEWLPTREEIAAARRMLDAYQMELNAYSKVLWDLEHQHLLEVIKADRQKNLEEAALFPRRRKRCMDRVARADKALGILDQIAQEVTA